jgi:putative RNA 2'-phosphotransferase
MNKDRSTKISKFLSLVLRHKPETIGLSLDENGWGNVADLLKASASHGNSFTREDLDAVVETNDEKRFIFDDSGERIRAAQGHSLKVDLEFEKRTPPAILYHGTAERNVDAIMASGLKKMQRHHVHLSADPDTALNVGIRYGKPVIFRVDTVGMIAGGFEFYISANGVWLVDSVPVRFLEQC